MLADARVVEHYHSYKHLNDPMLVREQAQRDFWSHFETSRRDAGLEIWAAYGIDSGTELVGWSGFLQTSWSDRHGGPELQYMIAGDAHGRGYATELARAVLEHGRREMGLRKVIAVVDIPNVGSLRVLEKLGFTRVGQIEAYGSTDMYLYQRTLS